MKWKALRQVGFSLKSQYISTEKTAHYKTLQGRW